MYSLGFRLSQAFLLRGMQMMTTLFEIVVLAAISACQSGLSRDKKGTGQVALEGSFDLEASADTALQFFTPEGERAWVKDWNPTSVYPPQATVPLQMNAVFWVNQGDERSLWTVLQANMQEHTAEYIYVVQDERLSRVRIEIIPVGVKHCRVRVYYVHTATSKKGLQFVAGMTEEAFAQKMRDWQRMVSAAIRQLS
jgi:hypothetical protein